MKYAIRERKGWGWNWLTDQDLRRHAAIGEPLQVLVCHGSKKDRAIFDNRGEALAIVRRMNAASKYVVLVRIGSKDKS